MSSYEGFKVLFEKMRLVALIIMVPAWLNNSVTVSSYEGFKFFARKNAPGCADHFSTGLA